MGLRKVLPHYLRLILFDKLLSALAWSACFKGMLELTLSQGSEIRDCSARNIPLLRLLCFRSLTLLRLTLGYLKFPKSKVLKFESDLSLPNCSFDAITGRGCNDSELSLRSARSLLLS